MAGVLDELLQNVRQNDSDWKNAKDAIVRKGVPVPEGTPTSEYGEKILSIESGVDTSGDTVVPSALREGYTAHNAAGQEITGTIPDYSGGNNVEMTSPEGATMNTAGTYCEGDIEVVPKLQSKTATTGEIVTADDGYAGLSEVDTNPAFEAGKKSEYDAFWDAYQEKGRRDNFNYGFFGHGWDEKTYKPKYPFPQIVYFGSMFMLSDIEDTKYPLDFTKKAIQYAEVFRACNELKTIVKIVVEETLTYKDWFDGCTSLVNLTIEGTIGQGGLNLSWSPLSKDSLISVVNALSSTTTGQPVTLRLAAVNTAFETTAGAADGSTSEEWTALIATKPNWTINLINS